MASTIFKDDKDMVMMMSKDEYDKTSKAKLEPDDDEEAEPRGLILPNGEINWRCPCLGDIATGPCAFPFREAFSCFHKSTATPKGTDCIEKFGAMQDCMDSYPELYDTGDDESNPIADAVNADAASQQSSSFSSSSSSRTAAPSTSQSAPPTNTSSSASAASSPAPSSSNAYSYAPEMPTHSHPTDRSWKPTFAKRS